MNAHAILTAIRELKKNDPAEFATFEKDYAEEMTEGVSFWSANSGYITLWKLQEGVEVSGCELEGASRLGDEWGCLNGISTRTITKKMVEREDFYEEDDEKETPAVVPVEEEENGCDCGCGCGAPCSIDDPKTVRQENAKATPAVVPVEEEGIWCDCGCGIPAKPMKAYENTKAMKAYVKARMNHLMGRGQKKMERYEGDGEAKCLLTRREEWDEAEFDNIICSLCDKRDEELNAKKGAYDFEVGAEITDHDKEWTMSVSWVWLNDTIPFEDFYDEEEDTDGSDSDDE